MVSTNFLSESFFKRNNDYYNTKSITSESLKDYVFDVPEINNETFLDLSESDKEYLMNISYQVVDDYSNEKIITRNIIFDERLDNIDNKVFIGFRLNGRKKGSCSSQKTNLAETVYEATLWAIEDERYSGSITRDDIEDLKIEIIIIGDEKPLDSNYEKGIHGIRIIGNNNEATYYNTVAIEGNHELEIILEKLCKKAGLAEDCSVENFTNIYYFPTIHFATTRFSEKIITYYRCHDPEQLAELSIKKIKSALNLAKNWLYSNFNYYGFFNYEYYPSNGDYANNNNIIRQLMASRLLALEVGEPEDLNNWTIIDRMHRHNLEAIFNNWYREQGNNG